MRPLKPDLSRSVHYRPSPSCGLSDCELHHAVIIRVLSDSLVNLLVIDGNNGSSNFKQAVRLYGPNDGALPNQGPYCVWPEAVVRMERAGANLERACNERGYTMEQVANGDESRDMAAKRAAEETALNTDGTGSGEETQAPAVLPEGEAADEQPHL